MSWRNVTIKEICKIKSGKRLPKGKSFSVEETNFPYIRARDIKAGKINSENLVYLDEVTQKKLSQYIVNKDDIVITVVGASVGDVGYVSEELDGYNLTENAVRLTEFDESVNSLYLLYLLNSQKYWEIMQSIAGGSAQPKLGIYKVESIPLELPTLDIQNRIVKSISSYDNLIENNQKQIKLLEEAAQRLYKEWFIDLRFPGYENVEIIDGMPIDWRKGTFESFVDVTMGQSPKSIFYNQDGDGIAFHQGVGSYGDRFVKDSIYSTSTTRIAEAGSILFSVRAPVGRLNITKNRIIIGRGLAALKQKSNYQSFLFYMLKEFFFRDNIVGNGSIFASITKDELLSLSFVFPNENLIKQFNDVAINIDKKIEYLDMQINLLTEARDRLLPKLMSGEIEV
nr:restriction endonuclease subunit S [uncultured Prevotella sp.]